MNKQQQQKQQQQPKEHLHSGTLYPWVRKRFIKDMQQQGDPGTFQGYQHYKNPLYGP